MLQWAVDGFGLQWDGDGWAYLWSKVLESPTWLLRWQPYESYHLLSRIQYVSLPTLHLRRHSGYLMEPPAGSRRVGGPALPGRMRTVGERCFWTGALRGRSPCTREGRRPDRVKAGVRGEGLGVRSASQLGQSRFGYFNFDTECVDAHSLAWAGQGLGRTFCLFSREYAGEPDRLFGSP